jgi:hypothetical protein
MVLGADACRSGRTRTKTGDVSGPRVPRLRALLFGWVALLIGGSTDDGGASWRARYQGPILAIPADSP